MNLNQTIEAARNVLRFKHMAVKTEKSYVHWIRRFAFWCKDHPAGSHEDKVRGFLTHLARERDVSASTQNQALNAIVFLYKHVLTRKRRIRSQLQRMNVAAEKAGFHRTESITS